ncbi:MAG TPA: deoxyhypusine synthase family protein [Phycisphaerae bacterium]|nr:deoxyhypusine synthase family protein [Phycisphaerae bacterium]
MAKKLNLQPLELLDLGKCGTVGEIVDGMSRCAFGARMLGEVAATLTGWCVGGEKPVVIYDGLATSPLGKMLKRLSGNRGFFGQVMTPEGYEGLGARGQGRVKRAVVVGGYSERHAGALYAREAGSTIYINPYDLCKPGQVKDGFFPDAVFADPNFIVPILMVVLEERVKGKGRRVAELLEILGEMPGVGMQVRQGAEVVRQMMTRKGIVRFLTLSGAMTIAQLSLVLCDMIDRGMVDSVTSTGALMAHGLVPGLGLKHYKYNPKDDDEKLAKLGLNRVTDVLEPETNFDHIDEIMSAVLGTFSGNETISPSILHAGLGKYLEEHYPEHRAILLSAYRKKVPVFVPAFTDSELGNDVYCTNKIRELMGKKRIVMDMEKDTAKLLELMTSAPAAGIWTFGGGVPRNWTQNVSPLIEIYNNRMTGAKGGAKFPMRKYGFGVRCCPDRPHFGHLSGCTYQEGMSWRKFHFNMKQAQIQADATQVEPLLVKYVMDLQDEGRI